MTRDISYRDNLADVVGLKRTNSVLLLGGNFVLPTLKKYVHSVEQAKKNTQVNKLLFSGIKFDRVFLARENVLDEVFVLKAARLIDVQGLVCFFSEEDGMRAAFSDIIERNFPAADVWNFESTVGKMVVTNAHGLPTWVD